MSAPSGQVACSSNGDTTRLGFLALGRVTGNDPVLHLSPYLVLVDLIGDAKTSAIRADIVLAVNRSKALVFPKSIRPSTVSKPFSMLMSTLSLPTPASPGPP
jgi:hypothetical protein